VIIANWKANGDIESNKAWCNQLILRMSDRGLKSVGIAPSYLHFNQIKKAFKNNDIEIGFQDIDIDGGARTGSISPSMADDSNCSFCLIGHSERREIFNEDNNIISKKYHMLTKNHIKPILCIGESFSEFQAGKTEKKLQTQIEECIRGNISSENLVIAYEPIWAIGTGNTPKPKDVNTIHEFIKDVVQSASENNLRPQVLYGGSVNKSNAADFFVEKNIDGALVGGASLDADIFSDIIEIYSRHKEK
jgi:triosephosphate isomerase